MTKLRILELWRYPIKSCAGERVGELALDQFGPLMDRRYMLVDANGKFIRQQYVPCVACVQAQAEEAGLTVRFNNEAPFWIPRPAPAKAVQVPVTIWNDQCQAEDQGEAAAAWFSAVLGMACRLVRTGDGYHRQVSLKYGRVGDQVGFADGYPLTLAVRESMDDLNRRIATRGGSHISLTRFRPTIVLEGAEGPLTIDDGIPETNEFGDRMVALPEDAWKRLVIRRGNIKQSYRNAKACARCPITTIDQGTGIKMGKEPLATLATYRFKAPRLNDAKPEAKVLFCWNLIHDYQQGVPMSLRVGDVFEVE